MNPIKINNEQELRIFNQVGQGFIFCQRVHECDIVAVRRMLDEEHVADSAAYARYFFEERDEEEADEEFYPLSNLMVFLHTTAVGDRALQNVAQSGRVDILEVLDAVENSELESYDFLCFLLSRRTVLMERQHSVG